MVVLPLSRQRARMDSSSLAFDAECRFTQADKYALGVTMPASL
jgi:hypothetical protein